jgi:hypothetical protein
MKLNNLFNAIKKKHFKTDFVRWKDKDNLLHAWDDRTIYMSNFITQNSTILDVGCGNQILKRYLPTSCNYIPVDLYKRTSDTIVVNLNNKIKIKNLIPIDYTFFSGVLEYVNDLEYVIKYFKSHSQFIILSYNPVDSVPCLIKRKELGWINHLDKNELLDLIKRCNFSVMINEFKFNQMIVLAKKT